MAPQRSSAQNQCKGSGRDVVKNDNMLIKYLSPVRQPAAFVTAQSFEKHIALSRPAIVRL
jgi:hypothetical protein